MYTPFRGICEQSRVPLGITTTTLRYSLIDICYSLVMLVDN